MSNSDHLVLLQKGKLADESALGQLNAMFEQIRTENRPNLVVHFHGGLISKEEGIAKAERLIPVYEEAKAYPVFFVWDSDFLKVIKRNLSEITQGKIGKQLYRWYLVVLQAKKELTPKGKARGGNVLLDLPKQKALWDEADRILSGESSDIAQDLYQAFAYPGTISFSEAESVQLLKYLEEDEELNATLEEAVSLQSSSPSQTTLAPEMLEQLRLNSMPGARGVIGTLAMPLAYRAVQAFQSVLKRLTYQRDHGLYATLVEELLRALFLDKLIKVAWEAMKSETLQAFDDDSISGGSAFLKRLNELASKGQKPCVTLVGHSTGAIYICHWLQHIQKMKVLPDDFTFKVIFLAPAVDFELFANTLNICENRISFFRMFTMTDEYEKQDRVISSLPIYPHSLLYLVSGVLEDEADKPIVGMERFLSETLFPGNRFSAIGRVRSYLLATGENRVVWSSTDRGPGLASRAFTHGGFDSDEATLKSLQQIIGRIQ